MFDNLIPLYDVSKLTEEEYAIVRKDYLGASDSSVILGVNVFTTEEQLLNQKNNKFITEEEKEIGKKPAVMKGKELEPLILDKYRKALGDEIVNLFKPDYMYGIPDYPFLTVNYDAGCETKELEYPVECKLVTKYGEKYYNKLKTIQENIDVEVKKYDEDISIHVKAIALKYGVPPYYYTQVQQQLIGMPKAPYGDLAVLFDDTWTFKYYRIKRDPYTISHIISKGARVYEKMEPHIKGGKDDTNN